jgi:hypothetical protein
MQFKLTVDLEFSFSMGIYSIYRRLFPEYYIDRRCNLDRPSISSSTVDSHVQFEFKLRASGVSLDRG